MSYKPLHTIDAYQAADQRARMREQKRRHRAKKKGEVYPPPPPIPKSALPALPVIRARPPRDAAYTKYIERCRAEAAVRLGADPDYVPKPRDPDEWITPRHTSTAPAREPTQAEVEEGDRRWAEAEADPRFQAIRARLREQ